MNQPQGNPVNPQYIINEYQRKVANLSNELVMLTAYVVQLEEENKKLKEAKND